MGREFFGGRARRKQMLGAKLDRPTANIPQNGQYALFNITGGKVLMTLIVGEVTVDIGSTVSLKLIATPTVGTATDLCAAVDMASCVKGDLLGITGTPGDNMLVANKSAIQAMLTGGVILTPGVLDLDTTASTTGKVTWLITYIPLDDGAEMTVDTSGTTV